MKTSKVIALIVAIILIIFNIIGWNAMYEQGTPICDEPSLDLYNIVGIIGQLIGSSFLFLIGLIIILIIIFSNRKNKNKEK
jgi:hypothetical protein